jgi:hypothetical protein
MLHHDHANNILSDFFILWELFSCGILDRPQLPESSEQIDKPCNAVGSFRVRREAMTRSSFSNEANNLNTVHHLHVKPDRTGVLLVKAMPWKSA